MAKLTKSSTFNGANLGFEEGLWQADNKLCGHMRAGLHTLADFPDPKLREAAQSLQKLKLGIPNRGQ